MTTSIRSRKNNKARRDRLDRSWRKAPGYGRRLRKERSIKKRNERRDAIKQNL